MPQDDFPVRPSRAVPSDRETVPEEAVVSVAAIDELSARDILGILHVRQAVFVVEQDCPYPDIDQIDSAPDTLHHFVSVDGQVVSTMRSYVDGAQAHIGRVSTLPQWRSQGYSRRLMNAAIARLRGDFPRLDIQIGAQAYLKQWYETFGYRQCADGYVEDGIPHIPMLLT